MSQLIHPHSAYRYHELDDQNLSDQAIVVKVKLAIGGGPDYAVYISDPADPSESMDKVVPEVGKVLAKTLWPRIDLSGRYHR